MRQYKVKLDYFKPSGKWGYSGEYVSTREHLFQIWDEVEKMDPKPGLVGNWTGPILVRVPDHENDHPHLVMSGEEPRTGEFPNWSALVDKHPVVKWLWMYRWTMPSDNLEAREKTTGDKAELISSLITDCGKTLKEPDKEHFPVLDLDFPVVLLPSSSPGHHLILEHELSTADYEKLLAVLVEVGICQKGFARRLKTDGATFVRCPWVKKTPDEVRYGPEEGTEG